MNDKPIRIEMLGLMPKTVSILHENGVNTLDDLLLLNDSVIFNMDGLSYHRAVKVRDCKQKCKKVLEKLERASSLDIAPELYKTSYDSISELLANQGRPRNVELFVKYYTVPGMTLDKLASEYDITHERARQICDNILAKVRNGLKNGLVNPELMASIERAAEAKTEIHLIDVSDKLLGKEGLVKVIARVYPDKIEILKMPKLNGVWVTKKEDNVKNMIDYLSKMLNERESPMRTEEMLSLFPISKDMLFSIKNIVEKDGYITLSTNKMVTGKVSKIKEYLMTIGRPASMREISDNTGLGLGQVRGAVSNKNEFENVGRCVYDSTSADYSDLTPSALAKNLLLAEGKPIKVQRIVKYVLKYDYSDLSERDVLIELFARGDSEVYHSNGYVLLKEWGREMIEKSIPKRGKYAVELRDAIKNVVKEISGIFDARIVLEKVKNTYGDNASNNLSSVRSVLSVLAKRGDIVEVGKHSGCYRLPIDGNL